MTRQELIESILLEVSRRAARNVGRWAGGAAGVLPGAFVGAAVPAAISMGSRNMGVGSRSRWDRGIQAGATIGAGLGATIGARTGENIADMMTSPDSPKEQKAREQKQSPLGKKLRSWGAKYGPAVAGAGYVGAMLHQHTRSMNKRAKIIDDYYKRKKAGPPKLLGA